MPGRGYHDPEKNNNANEPTKVKSASTPTPAKAAPSPSPYPGRAGFSQASACGGLQSASERKLASSEEGLRVLKVGKAGPNCSPRFQSQHYNAGSAPSTLSGMLLKGRILWPYLGISDLSEDTAGEWIKANTDRYNIYLPVSSNTPLLDLLERYIRGRVGPVFEG